MALVFNSFKQFIRYSLPRLGIEGKLYLIIFVPISIVVTISGALFYRSVSKDVTQKQYAYMGQNLRNIDKYLEQHINTVQNILAEIYDNDILTQGKSTAELADIFENYRMYHISILNSIYLINKDGSYIGTSNLDFNLTDPRTLGVYIEAEQSNGRIFWMPYYKSPVGGRVVTCARAITDSRGSFLGVMAIDISLEKLGVIFNSINFGENGKVYIVCNGETVISYSRYNDKFFGNVSSADENYISGEQLKGALKAEDGANIIVDKNGQKLMLSYRKSSLFGWYIVGITKADEVFNSVYRIKIYAIWIVLCTIIMLFVVSYFINRLFIKPIKKISEGMNIINAGNLQVRVNVESKDEIGYLAASFNNMSERIEQLIKNLVLTENSKKQYEFKVLQAQINPHFLYNTLNSINMMAILNKVDEIHPMIVSLVNLLQSSIDKVGEYITVREELENLKSYVYILKARYPDKFDVFYDIDTSADQYKTLKLILQPLIENAIFHGIIPDEGKGSVHVKVSCAEQVLTYEVEDSGVGMDSSLTNSILYAGPQMHEQGFNRIGLRNVHERIQLYFGKRWGCTIESQKGKGTRVTVCFPASVYEVGGGTDGRAI